MSNWKEAVESSKDKPMTDARPLDQPPQHIIDLAVQVSTWSPCRSKRGVVISISENVLAHGYNFKPRAFACDGSDACKATCRVDAIHAEQMALLSLGSLRASGADILHVKTVDGVLVPSGGPSCVECSKLALVCGIKAFWLYHEDGWRCYSIEEFHRLSLAEVERRRDAPAPPRAGLSFSADETDTCPNCGGSFEATGGKPKTGRFECQKCYIKRLHDNDTPSGLATSCPKHSLWYAEGAGCPLCSKDKP